MTSHADLGSPISSLYSSRVASSLEGLLEAARAAAEQSVRWKLPRERVPARAPQTQTRLAFEEV